MLKIILLTVLVTILLLLLPLKSIASERVLPELPSGGTLTELSSFPCNEDIIIIVYDYTFTLNHTAIELYTNENMEHPFALGLTTLDPPDIIIFVNEYGSVVIYDDEEEFAEEYPDGFCDLVLEEKTEL